MALFALAAALAVGALGSKIGASERRKSAARAQRQIAGIQGKQRRRAFINRFRQAQADTLAAGIATGAGLGSSAVQGTLASQRTQRNVAEGEFIDQSRLSLKASKKLEKAADFDLAAGAFSTAASFAASAP